jgi:hypothetical protein
MAQQTAVEWFAERLTLNGLADYLTVEEESLYNKLKEQAKEMDKRQKKRAWDRGKYIGQSFPKGQIEPEYEQDAEEYYTQTYGK